MEATAYSLPLKCLLVHVWKSHHSCSCKHFFTFISLQSPADLCGKIEKGDEVVQVDQKTVVGISQPENSHCGRYLIGRYLATRKQW